MKLLIYKPPSIPDKFLKEYLEIDQAYKNMKNGGIIGNYSVEPNTLEGTIDTYVTPTTPIKFIKVNVIINPKR